MPKTVQLYRVGNADFSLVEFSVLFASLREAKINLISRKMVTLTKFKFWNLNKFPVVLGSTRLSNMLTFELNVFELNSKLIQRG